MHRLTNEHLTVVLLDPVAESERFGVRYCTGGYIYQVEDGDGPLLSGPTYPASFNWFDGQGIPDSFAQSPLRDPVAPGSEALILGVGRCDTARREVIEYCTWKVAHLDGAYSYITRQAFGDYGVLLERTVSLDARVVRSRTRVSNTGKAQIPLRWFPHPFYPVPAGDDLCWLPGPITVPGNTTYSVGATGYLRCSDLSALQAVPVVCNAGGPLTVLQRHPRLGVVAAAYSFAAGHVLVWGNENTFSFEPYLERTVGPGMELEWSAEYHF